MEYLGRRTRPGSLAYDKYREIIGSKGEAEDFAPDVEGFTILLAAAGPGSFAATGRYEVVAA